MWFYSSRMAVQDIDRDSGAELGTACAVVDGKTRTGVDCILFRRPGLAQERPFTVERDLDVYCALY